MLYFIEVYFCSSPLITGGKKKSGTKVIGSVSLSSPDDSDLLDENNLEELQIRWVCLSSDSQDSP